MCYKLTCLFTLLICGLLARADTIEVTGIITQSQNDQPGNPAINNPSLNNINDGDSYNFTFDFSSITAPGTYALTGGLFSDPGAHASENGFTGGTILVSQASGIDTFNVQACLGAFTCNTGNELDLNFTIPAAVLDGSGSASSIPALLPMDLLEDDGSTDIHGSVDGYAYQSAPVVPEPGTFLLLGSGLAGLVGAARRRKNQQAS